MNKIPCLIAFFTISLGSAAAPPPEKAEKGEVIWVFKKDGSQSCGLMPGDSVESDKVRLEKAGVKVLEAKKSNDGKLHIQSCGADTGQVNQFKIERKNLEKAISLGYQLQK